MPTTLLIDLDDTLFDERQYVDSGFRFIAGNMAYLFDLSAGDVYDHMQKLLAREGRGQIFDHTLEAFGIEPKPEIVAGLVRRYRTHAPSLGFFPGVREALDELKATYKLALVTNGHVAMQARKVAALAAENWFEVVVFCDKLGHPKPAPEGPLAACKLLGVKPRNALMVGDNPETDGGAARAAGMGYLRINTARFAATASDAPSVATFADVPAYLRGL